MKFTKVGRKTIAAWKAHPRYISSCGGTRSGKTYSILQTFILALVEEVNKGKPATINSVVSESMPHLQRGAIRDFKQIMEVEGLWEDARWMRHNTPIPGAMAASWNSFLSIMPVRCMDLPGTDS